MIRLLISLIFLGGIAYGGWWLWENFPEAQNVVKEYINSGEFLTLEARYTPEQIMETNSKELLKDSSYTFLKPTTCFAPYFLLNIKYSKDDQQTGEGIILWSSEDGEMVINTSTWEKTHGFEDCINAKATKNDLKVINALAKKDAMNYEELLARLSVENEALDQWLTSCHQKQLIVQNKNYYRLHFQNPHLQVIPETRVHQWLVTKPYKGTNIRPRKYSESQIRHFAAAVFGKDFAIRKVTEVFLPIYEIKVKNPDNTVLSSYWNAITGKRVLEYSL